MPNMDPKKCPMPSQEPNVRNKNFKEVALGYTEEMAVNEAKRCLQCKNHPCRTGCPVEIDIPGFIKHVAEGDFEAAYHVIAQSSALPAVCGRVCPQEHQCEGKCVRGIKGESVGIGRLERFVADWYRNNLHTKPTAPAPNGHKVAVIGAGPSGLTVAGDLAKLGYKVTGIVGFRNKDLVILEDEFRACCDEFIIMTDDGSYGEKGVVTAPLEQKIVDGANFDEVITIGPLIMMKFVVKTTKPHNVKTVVSMNPIMVDGTGMCGGCRLTVGGKTKFACVDGPDFDGFEVDFDEAMHRGTMYKPFEAHAREAECNLLKQEVQ